MKNFVVDQGIALKGEGYYHDLHNLFDVVKLELDIKNNQGSLWLSQVTEEGQSKESSKVIRIVFVTISYVEVSRGITQDASVNLEEIGYKNPGDDDLDWLIPDENASENDHLIFRFGNDEYLRIFCEKVEILF